MDGGLAGDHGWAPRKPVQAREAHVKRLQQADEEQDERVEELGVSISEAASGCQLPKTQP